jgi:hypothetical protein
MTLIKINNGDTDKAKGPRLISVIIPPTLAALLSKYCSLSTSAYCSLQKLMGLMLVAAAESAKELRVAYSSVNPIFAI